MTATFQSGNDTCLNIFATLYPHAIDFPHGARVLEIGCAEADWLTPMKDARPDLHLTGIDVRACDRPGAQLLIRGDVLQQQFASESFEAVVLVSALEHVGLTHYGDPHDPDGDSRTMNLIWDWLVPGGQVYFDVPWAPAQGYEVHGTSHRRYDDPTIQSRLAQRPWNQIRTAYTTANETTALIMKPESLTGPFFYAAYVWQKPS